MWKSLGSSRLLGSASAFCELCVASAIPESFAHLAIQPFCSQPEISNFES
jgi:hypothetical protein